MARLLKEEIISAEELSRGVYRLRVSSPFVAETALPGQFVSIKCTEGLNAFLRRPISICSTDRAGGMFDIVFQVKGAGTGFLSRVRPGDRLDFIAPLGRPFDTSASTGRVAVVGGGIGVFPLLFLLRELKGSGKTALLGFKSSDSIVLRDEFEKYADETRIATDDGSCGVKGNAGLLLEEELGDRCPDMVYACGPTPMLKKIAGIASEHGIRCQVSLEQRMGCGIGACLVCACQTKRGDGWDYSRVCKDGPVFWSDEVIFEPARGECGAPAR